MSTSLDDRDADVPMFEVGRWLADRRSVMDSSVKLVLTDVEVAELTTALHAFIDRSAVGGPFDDTQAGDESSSGDSSPGSDHPVDGSSGGDSQ